MNVREEIDDFMNQIMCEINKAQKEAFKKGIEANSIILNENHTYVKSFYYSVCRLGMDIYDTVQYQYVGPMIMGKKLFLGPLPEQYDYALIQTPSLETKRLKELMKKYVVIRNGQLVFKNISFKMIP